MRKHKMMMHKKIRVKGGGVVYDIRQMGKNGLQSFGTVVKNGVRMLVPIVRRMAGPYGQAIFPNNQVVQAPPGGKQGFKGGAVSFKSAVYKPVLPSSVYSGIEQAFRPRKSGGYIRQIR